jgi:hypothetical protein
MNKQLFGYVIIYIVAYLSVVLLGHMNMISMNMTLVGIAVLSLLLTPIMCRMNNLYIIFILCGIAFVQGISVKFNYPWVVYISLGTILLVTIGICVTCYLRQASYLRIQKNSLQMQGK